MRLHLLITLFFIIFILNSCEYSENSIISTDTRSEIYPDSTILGMQTGVDWLDLLRVFNAEKVIDGAIGGEIVLDTNYINEQGYTVSISASLLLPPNSFSGIKNISMSPDPITGSIKFSPAMTFDIPVQLNLNFTGINLSSLGFYANSTVDFVFMSADGTTEIILKDECKIKWSQQKIYVKKAKITHFSRYVFVRKCQ